MRVIFVHHGDVVENVFAVFVHAAHAVLNDHHDFVTEGRVVGHAARHGAGQHVAVAVLVLQAFAGKRGAAGGGAQQKAPCAGIRRCPDKIANALKAKHGIKDIKRQHRHAVGMVANARREPRRNRARFGDAVFDDLAVFGFFVIEQFVLVFGLVKLADGRINRHLAKQRLHAEGTRFVGNDGHDVFAQFFIAQQLRQHLHKHHGGR